jgi:glycosyltransferase involved in cell wall biosynthesis
LLYLLPAAGFGGAERQGVYHLAELPGHGVDVTAFVGPGDPIVHALDDVHASYQRFEHFPARDHGPLTSLGNVLHPFRSVAQIWSAVSEIERRVQGDRFDLIFANRTFAWVVAALLSQRLGVPYVLRAGSRLAHPAYAIGLRALDVTARPAAAFFNCRAVERDVVSHLRCPAISLPNAVDVVRFAPASRGARDAARSRLGLALDAPMIGLAARPAPEKGFDFFERVVAEVRRARPHARFVVAGEFGWRKRYEARFRAAGLGEAVRFLGRVESVPDFLHAMDIAILTSRARSIEASPNALLEAMAAGRPIVATSVGGIPEMIHHGKEGYLVRHDDPEGFAAHVVDLVDSEPLRDKVGLAGRARAVSRHRVSTIVAGLARDLYSIVHCYAAQPVAMGA